ncbi:MAG TPA: NAD(+) diphosphatase [Candidatus Aquilonibacter sp.]
MPETDGDEFFLSIEPRTTAGEPYIFAFSGSELVLAADALPSLAAFGPGTSLEGAICIGEWRGRRTCYALALLDPEPPPGLRRIGLRAVYGELGAAAFAIASRAAQLLTWDREHRFCGACGTATQRAAGEPARICPACNLHAYPRISPAIMVLIHRGREVLLARNRRNATGAFSALAGFVEAGETLEETIVREVREEVGVDIRDIRYFGSQSWPFPHSLMIAYTAAYAAGEIVPDGIEIEEARFFDVDALPKLPAAGLSIASRLIGTVAAQLRAGRRPSTGPEKGYPASNAWHS